VLLVASGAAFAEEVEVFGLKEGMTKEEVVAKCKVMEPHKGGKGSLKLYRVVPKVSNAAIDNVYVAISDKYGLQKITCFTPKDNCTFDTIYRRFSHIVAALGRKYGAPSAVDIEAESLDDIRYVDDKNVRAYWDKGEVFVSAEIVVDARMRSEIAINYEFSKWTLRQLRRTFRSTRRGATRR